MIPSPSHAAAEEFVVNAVLWLKLAVEATGALIIGIGVAIAVYLFIKMYLRRGPRDFSVIRLTLARYLALALEFQLGADILSTAVAPTWDEIGKLGAIAIIRTALNYFLTREIQEHKIGSRTAPAPDPI